MTAAPEGGVTVALSSDNAAAVSVPASVTVPAFWPTEEFGRSLESSIRRAGFTPHRLDLAADSGFIAATIPLGVGLRPRGTR